ncbi:MAG: outer membrane protein assembly factor BamE [Steroidobacteraceae bacterium]
MKVITDTADSLESSAGRTGSALPQRRRRRPAASARSAALLALLLPLAGMLGACVYRMPVRQGNFLDPAAIAQVKPGMTPSQVRYLLGTPMIPGTFDDRRWDYDYYLNLHRIRNPPRAHLTVYFANGVVARVVSNVTRAPVTYIVRHGVKYPTPY